MRRSLVALLVALLTASIAQAQAPLKFIIRVDDVLSRNTTFTPRSIVPFEQAVMSRGAKVTWGVIPHRLIEPTNADGKLAAELRQTVAKGNEVSLHGYNHICTRCGQTGHEMWCATYKTPFTYAEQSVWLRDGLTILRDQLGLTPTSFIPPGHYADTATYHALADAGLSVLSSTGPTRQDIRPGLYNVQQHREFTWTLMPVWYADSLHAALRDIRTRGERDSYYVLLLHDYFIRSGWENGVTLRWTSELLDSLNLRYGNRIAYRTLSEAAREFQSPTAVATRPAAPSPDGFALTGAAPNPFNPTTTIGYELTAVSRVRLEVFDALGRRMATLVDGEVGAGHRQAVWDASGLPAGSYVAVLTVQPTAGGPPRRQSRPMLLLK